ncbi:hypothetical protein PROFUN_02769 [Planoprotostelium fungivorum]|uniref:Uncharacterized protein n=1 Tax=Planoprotostelium fungivorum TaxID=1890364 RepID=A0A2P6NXI3_9EUKA|nr:hypothetical protein PROFUN_02769 [Planoprotostelium fungivorum]
MPPSAQRSTCRDASYATVRLQHPMPMNSECILIAVQHRYLPGDAPEIKRCHKHLQSDALPTELLRRLISKMPLSTLILKPTQIFHEESRLRGN